jgi:predicted nucleotidyltransferase
MAETAQRERVREHVLRRAEEDERIVAAALVGSLASSEGDRWSDLDFTFGVAQDTGVKEVLEDWTRELANEFGTVPLIDLERGELLYRVFLFPDWLQLDLSFTPGRTVQTSLSFKPLFGETEEDFTPPPDPRELFGYAVLFTRHALIATERELWWHAEYCVSEVRDLALTIACFRRELPPYYGKGYDRLPPELLQAAEDALVRSLDRDELRRALGAAVAVLLAETEDDDEHVAGLRQQLREL